MYVSSVIFTFIVCLNASFLCVTINETIDNSEVLKTLKKRFINFVNSIEDPFQETHYGRNFDDTYDFIIVGSGSSGAVLANRLSEIASWKILLLEAGNPANPLTQIPVLAPLFQLTPYNWKYTMQRQDGVCLAMEDGICAWPRGKALGGTSVINYMIYTRGNPKDYEKWFELGNPGWSYNEVLPYFLKSERCNLGKNVCSNGYHNANGYLSVEYPFKSRITDAFIAAGIELGAKHVDYNTPNYMGFSQVQANQNFGRRHSTADAFLYPIINSRKNLKILTSVRVTKILIDPNTKNAYGVMFRKRGKTFMVKASKEVILSAGVLNSPQLLMLSGVGPKKHLEELKIPVIQNLPVGQLLYDHIAYLGLAFKINQTVEPREVILDPRESFKWIFQGKGVFTSLAGVEGLGYINTNTSNNLNYPDIELIMVGTGSLESDYGIVVAREIRLRRDIYNTVFKPLERTPAWSIIPMLLHPESRGHLKLKSKNPYDSPLFYGNYFSDPQQKDIKTFLASIRYIQRLSQTAAFQKFNSKIHDIPIPGCEKHKFDSDSYWLCALRSLTSTLHHQIGTCKMGPSNDTEAVVDERLKVYGITNLRVIDSSVIPTTLSAHINAPSIMIGEKGADMIKEDWGSL